LARGWNEGLVHSKDIDSVKKMAISLEEGLEKNLVLVVEGQKDPQTER